MLKRLGDEMHVILLDLLQFHSVPWNQ